MSIHTSTCLNKKVTYKVLDDLKVVLTIDENPYRIPLEKLFAMAARINKKRSFLFVSKVLGKHLPIKPSIGILTGLILASRYMEKVNGATPEARFKLVEQFLLEQSSPAVEPFVPKQYNPIIIGFAETATALGHAFFEAFSKADYFHTTRELLKEATPAITFEEEHSHATSHRAYIDSALLDNDREIILVDDEVTTGKTALNIIRSLQNKHKRKKYTVVSILDWRSKEHEDLFKETEKELGITIHTVSLVKGTICLEGKLKLHHGFSEDNSDRFNTLQNVSFHFATTPKLAPYVSTENDAPYLLYTARFGLSAGQNRNANMWMKKLGEELRNLRTGKRTLVLGTGEFMYIPMKIASLMGEGVKFHSTTRSPIYPVQQENYGAQNRYTFANPEDIQIQNYLYNIFPKQYDEIFILCEKEIEPQNLNEMLEQLKKTNIEEIKIVFFSKRAGGDENV